MTLSDYLKQNHITYEAFAAALGLWKRKNGKGAGMNIYRYCTGERIPNFHTAKKIVAVTKGKVSLDDVYSESA